MNHLPPSPRGGLHRTLRLLSLLVLNHALNPTSTVANGRSRLPGSSDGEAGSDPESRPYLSVAGSVPLRFSAPPRHISNLVTRSVVTPQIVAPAPTTPTEPAPAPLSPNLESKVLPIETSPVPTIPTTNKSAPAILPDDTRPSTRPEDFLPFFKFPGTGDVTVPSPATIPSPPTPGQLPASSATYQQR